MTRHTIFHVLLACAVLVTCAPALADPGPTDIVAPSAPEFDAVTKRVGSSLHRVHGIPSKAELVVIAGDADSARDALIRIAKRKPLMLRLRQRALTALVQWAGDPEVFATYVEVLATEGASGIIGRQTIASLVAAFPSASVPVVAPMLEHEDPRVRAVTVQALSQGGGQGADAALSRARARETNPDVLALYD